MVRYFDPASLNWDPRLQYFNCDTLNNYYLTRPEFANKAIDVKVEVSRDYQYKFNNQAELMPLTMIVPANANDPGSFKVWYLPYYDNQIKHLTMDPRISRIMLTASMTGCTFGRGTSGADGTLMVSHANNAAGGIAGGATGQARAQRDQTTQLFGNNRLKMLQPKHYMNRERTTKLVLFGIYSERELAAAAQGRSGFKNFFLKLRSESRPKWRFYKHTATKLDGLPDEVIELSTRVDRL